MDVETWGVSGLEDMLVCSFKLVADVVWQLQCTECNAFYIGEIYHSLPDRMNGHRFPTTVRTQTYQLLSKLNSTRSLSRDIGLLVSYTNYLTPPQTISTANLKLHTNLSYNHDTTLVSISVKPPHIPSSPRRHLKILLQFLVFYC